MKIKFVLHMIQVWNDYSFVVLEFTVGGKNSELNFSYDFKFNII